VIVDCKRVAKRDGNAIYSMREKVCYEVVVYCLLLVGNGEKAGEFLNYGEINIHGWSSSVYVRDGST
jgi:hypothetical protein